MRGGASATGITYLLDRKIYVLAAYTTGYDAIDIYTTQPGILLGSSALQFTYKFRIYPLVDGSAPSYQSLNLFTESKLLGQTPYLLGFRHLDHNQEDWLDLIRLDIDAQSYSVVKTVHVDLKVELLANNIYIFESI